MNNLLSYFRLIDGRMRASDKDLSVSTPTSSYVWNFFGILQEFCGRLLLFWQNSDRKYLYEYNLSICIIYSFRYSLLRSVAIIFFVNKTLKSLNWPQVEKTFYYLEYLLIEDLEDLLTEDLLLYDYLTWNYEFENNDMYLVCLIWRGVLTNSVSNHPVE